MEKILITPRSVGPAKTMATKIIADEGIFFSDMANDFFSVDSPVEVEVEDREANGKQFKFIKSLAVGTAYVDEASTLDAESLQVRIFLAWVRSPYVANQMKSESEVVGLVKKLTMKSLEALK
jgi:hypothetical protein